MTFRNNWGEDRVYFYDDNERLATVPVQWTTLAAFDPFVEIAGGRSPFRFGDLIELADLLVCFAGGKS